MRRFLSVLSVLSVLAGPAFGAASHNDAYVLTTDPTFGNRVLISLIAACVNIASEGYSVAFHRERARYCTQILNSPLTYKPVFINTTAADGTVLSDATQAGTVVLTSGNVAAQAALVTDAHIDTAISSDFNSFVVEPGS